MRGIDAVAVIDNNLLVIVQNCKWRIDLKSPKTLKNLGEPHEFTKAEVKAAYSLASKERTNKLVLIFQTINNETGSEIDTQTIRLKDGKSEWDKNPFLGLASYLSMEIKAAFVWQDDFLYVFQDSLYIPMTANSLRPLKASTIHSPITDFELTSNIDINAAYADQKMSQIYFFADAFVYTFEVKQHSNKTGQFVGSLKGTIDIENFFGCDQVSTNPIDNDNDKKNSAISYFPNSIQTLSSFFLTLYFV